MKILTLPIIILILMGISPILSGITTLLISLFTIFDNSLIWLLLIWPGLPILYLLITVYIIHRPDLNKFNMLNKNEKSALKDHFFYLSYTVTAVKYSQSIDYIRIIFILLAIVYVLQGFYLGALVGLFYYLTSSFQSKLNPGVYYVNAAKGGNGKAISRVRDLASIQEKLGIV